MAQMIGTLMDTSTNKLLFDITKQLLLSNSTKNLIWPVVLPDHAR